MTNPAVVVSQPDSDDFSRRLRIAEPSRSPRPQQGKLFDPLSDGRRTAEPEPLSDGGSSYVNVPRGSPHAHKAGAPASGREPPSAKRQLFDHRKDDPVRFHVLSTRPNQRPPAPVSKSSGDWVSVGSQSSYSVASSNFTLNSGTTGSSASSAAKEGDGSRRPSDEHSSNAFADQLKRLYRAITALEAMVSREEASDSHDDVRVVLRGAQEAAPVDEEARNDRWKKIIGDHKRFVSDRRDAICRRSRPCAASLR
jgi:protein SMG6